MGKRSMLNRRALKNRYRDPIGGPYQKYDPATDGWYWAGGVWDKADGQWREGRRNWRPTAPLYFAYGSNLNHEQMAWRAPEAKPFAKLLLPNWKLAFNSVADIEPAPGEACAGGLWSITGADELALDRYEGVRSGFYEKHYFPIAYTDEAGQRVETEVLVYIMKRRHGLWRPPEAYYESIVQGYKDFGLDEAYLQQACDEAEAATKNLYGGYYRERLQSWD